MISKEQSDLIKFIGELDKEAMFHLSTAFTSEHEEIKQRATKRAIGCYEDVLTLLNENLTALNN